MLELNQAQTRIWIWWLCLLCVHLTRCCLQAPEWRRINKKRVWMSHCIIVHQNPLTWHSVASGQGKQNMTLYNNRTFIGFLCLVSCEPYLHGLVCLLYVNVILEYKWINNTWEVWRVSSEEEVIIFLRPLLTRKVSHDDKLIRSVWIQNQPIRRPDVSATDQSEAPTAIRVSCFAGHLMSS